MSRLQAIEEALIGINGSVFQELCDRLLVRRNDNYRAVSRIGSQSGKQKTTKGTPDTFFLLRNSNFIYVETTTDKSNPQKLEGDIKACFDPSKTKIPIGKIEEIILCFNFNIDQDKMKHLDDLAKSYKNDIIVSYWSLDSLALELHNHHRNLVHECLDLPLDTGQIVSIDTFISEYNKASQGIATPLDNEFIYRKDEIKELCRIITESDFVIINGAPGVGKTRLALQTISEYVKENLDYHAMCVSYKSHTILDDLYQHFDNSNDYLLFVDDANRIDKFKQIIGFYKAKKSGNLKIVITVRDYAFKEMRMLCQEYKPESMKVKRFTDPQIIEIIKGKPLEILNHDYQKEIIRIADGNPRLAIMASLLAKEKQSVSSLFDVSDLFENYFSTFINDNGEFAEDLNLKCLGIIAFFSIISFEDKEKTEIVLNQFDIEYSNFIDAIKILNKLELIEFQFGYVKITEQNLSTYFFYKAFIKDELLSFDCLLKNYFISHSTRFTECVIPANNNFGMQKVMSKLKPSLQSYYGEIDKQDESIVFKFLSIFWYYLQDETMSYIYDLIIVLPNAGIDKYNVSYKEDKLAYNRNDVINTLVEFFRFDRNLKDALELAFEYIRKKPEHLPELIFQMINKLSFDKYDETVNFIRQKVLYDVLFNGLNNKDPMYVSTFYEITKNFLKHKFENTENGRKNTFSWYDYFISSTSTMMEFRKNIWTAIDDNYHINKDKSFELLLSYSFDEHDTVKEIVEYDLLFLVGIIERHLTNESFEHCLFVQDMIRTLKKNNVTHNSFLSLSKQFTNKLYELFLIIDYDRLKNKEMYEFDNPDGYLRLKENRIRASLVFRNKTDLNEFYSSFVFLQQRTSKKWKYNKVLDIVIDENIIHDFKIGFYFLELIIQNNELTNFIPNLIFRNHLIEKHKTDCIWELIESNSFCCKFHWKISYLSNIDDSLINVDHPKAIIEAIKNLNENVTIFVDNFVRYYDLCPNLFSDILEIVLKKNDEDNMNIVIWKHSFSKYIAKSKDDIEIFKKTYLQQKGIDYSFDYDNNGMKRILEIKPEFLIQYVNSLYNVRDNRFKELHGDFDFIWEVEKIEIQLSKVFNIVAEKERYYPISKCFANAFFVGINKSFKEKADSFLFKYVEVNYNNSSRMNIVIDIVRNSKKELFEQMLLFFLTLNQDLNVFSNIYWRGERAYHGNESYGEIQALDWKDILNIVEKSEVGVKLIPIKSYINSQIDDCHQFADIERRDRFLRDE
ncbi:MAG: DNA/RNA helicase domain-containing protein [Candidatus Cloacimonadales bacterium]